MCFIWKELSCAEPAICCLFLWWCVYVCSYDSLQKMKKQFFMVNFIENVGQSVLLQVPRTKLWHKVDEWPFCLLQKGLLFHSGTPKYWGPWQPPKTALLYWTGRNPALYPKPLRSLSDCLISSLLLAFSINN